MSDDLPMGWVNLTLELVGMPSTPNVDPSKFPNEVFELYSVPAYSNDEPEILPSSEIHSTKQAVETGDILLCKIVPHLNRVWIVKELSQHRQIA
ncbi:MAG: restriction endonuclease subunit S, partial [Pseudanabaena sp.]